MKLVYNLQDGVRHLASQKEQLIELFIYHYLHLTKSEALKRVEIKEYKEATCVLCDHYLVASFFTPTIKGDVISMKFRQWVNGPLWEEKHVQEKACLAKA